MDGNYIKLNRSILKWEWFKDINTCRIFIYMLLKANWTDEKFRGLVIPRGSFVSSIGKLAEETDLTEREVRTAISHLKMTGELTSKSTNRYTVFTVVNYCLYQANDKQADIQATSKRQANDKLTTTIEEYKEYKEYKEKKNTTPLSPLSRFDDFWSVYPKKKNRPNAERAYCKVLLDDARLTESDLVIAAENYVDAISILGTDERYIKNPDRFITDNTFVDYLKCNYKKPSAVKENGAKKNQFNQFPQRNYDFAELEKQLLSK